MFSPINFINQTKGSNMNKLKNQFNINKNYLNCHFFVNIKHRILCLSEVILGDCVTEAILQHKPIRSLPEEIERYFMGNECGDIRVTYGSEKERKITLVFNGKHKNGYNVLARDIEQFCQTPIDIYWHDTYCNTTIEGLFNRWLMEQVEIAYETHLETLNVLKQKLNENKLSSEFLDGMNLASVLTLDEMYFLSGLKTLSWFGKPINVEEFLKYTAVNSFLKRLEK